MPLESLQKWGLPLWSKSGSQTCAATKIVTRLRRLLAGRELDSMDPVTRDNVLVLVLSIRSGEAFERKAQLKTCSRKPNARQVRAAVLALPRTRRALRALGSGKRLARKQR